MKKIIFPGMLLLAISMLFASCSIDSQTDSDEQNSYQEFATDDGFTPITPPPPPPGGGYKP